MSFVQEETDVDKDETATTEVDVETKEESENKEEETAAWECSLCTMKFSSKEIFSEHTDEHRHDDLIAKFSCSRCNWRFISEEQCKSHIDNCSKPLPSTPPKDQQISPSNLETSSKVENTVSEDTKPENTKVWPGTLPLH